MAVLTVPFTATGQTGTYQLGLPGVTDFTTGTITISVYVQTPGSAVNLQAFVQTGANCYTPAFDGYKAVSGFTSGFATLTFNVGTGTTNGTGTACPLFNKSTVSYVGLQVVGPTSGTTFTSAVVYVDSITITGTSPTVTAYTFDTAASVGPNQALHTTDFGGGTAQTVAWQATYP